MMIEVKCLAFRHFVTYATNFTFREIPIKYKIQSDYFLSKCINIDKLSTCNIVIPYYESQLTTLSEMVLKYVFCVLVAIQVKYSRNLLSFNDLLLKLS